MRGGAFEHVSVGNLDIDVVRNWDADVIETLEKTQGGLAQCEI